MTKTHTLRFRAANRDIFEAIRDGTKKIETRAATVKYLTLKKGDRVVFVCGKEKFEKTVKRIVLFKSVSALVRKYRPEQINPKCRTLKELEAVYYTFPGYREKIRAHGLVALEFSS